MSLSLLVMTTMTTARHAPPTLRDLLQAQSGVLSRRQALAAGLTPHAWRWRLRSGRWQSLLPGVAVAHSGGVSDEERGWAAVLYCGEHTALTGDAALRLWGMTLPEPELWRVATPGRQLIAPHHSTLAQPLRVQPHRVVRLHEVIHPVRRPPVVRPAAALLHSAAWAPSARAAEWRIAAAVQQRLVTPKQVRATQQVLTRTHRRGLVAAVLDDVELGAHARSELDLLAFLRRHALPLPDRLQRPVRSGTKRCYLDAWWERQRVALEMDGMHHMLVGAWEADLLRANSLAVTHRDDRVLLLRLTAGHLRHAELQVAGLLRDALL